MRMLLRIGGVVNGVFAIVEMVRGNAATATAFLVLMFGLGTIAELDEIKSKIG